MEGWKDHPAQKLDDRCIQMYQDGMSLRRIAQEYGLAGHSTVERYLKRRNVQLRTYKKVVGKR